MVHLGKWPTSHITPFSGEKRKKEKRRKKNRTELLSSLSQTARRWLLRMLPTFAAADGQPISVLLSSDYFPIAICTPDVMLRSTDT